ncbi:MAG: diacylglycerol/lipid kinase family protein [Candidatus Dormibacteria bacterium]
MAQALVLFNPSRVGEPSSLRQALGQALDREGWPAPVFVETDPNGLGGGRLKQALTEGAELVFACGGDGTVVAAAEALADTGIPLAVLPSGTGNVLALNLGVPRDLAAAIQVGLHGARMQIDLGQEGQRLFTVACGIGFDARMVAAAPAGAKRRFGWVAYGLAGLRHLGGPRFEVELTLDGGTPIRRRVQGVLVANVGRLPGGINLMPRARPDDGLLDVGLIAPRHVPDWLRLLARAFGGRPEGVLPEHFTARRVEVVADSPQPREADGEALEPSRRLSVAIRSGALSVCVPA